MALLPGSPAIDAGGNSCPNAADQRAVSRPQGAACDIGAFESQGFSMTLNSGNNQSALVSTAFSNQLSVTVSSSHSEPVNGGQVTFTPPASGAGCSIVGMPATITGGTATTGTVTANATSGGFTVTTASAGVASPVSFNLSNQAPTTTTIAPDINPSFTSGTNSSVTFTAKVTSGGNPVATGTVTFKNGNTVLGSPVALNVSGQATYTTSFTGEGSFIISATYNATPSFGTSTDNVTQTVNKHTTVNGTTYCNPGGITLSPSGSTVPYPSNIFVSGVSGTIGLITLELNSITATNPSEVALLLVGPGGQKFVIMYGAGGTSDISTGVNLTLSDGGASFLPTSTYSSGTYKPADYGTPAFPSPAPAGPYSLPASGGSAILGSVFSGTVPNGTWSLYAIDAGTGNAAIAGGWCLNITPVIPLITSVVPNSGQQGATIASIAITGQNTHFVNGTSTANFGTGITVNSLTVTDATHATANITINPVASIGNRDVTMTTGGEVVILTNGFTITSGTTCPPTYTISASTASVNATTGTWTAPPLGGPYLIQIKAAGGQGGHVALSAGKGAVIQGDFVVNAGQTINLTAGATGYSGLSSGGGGGSGAYTLNNNNTNILIIAGGGGGAGYDGAGGDGQTVTSGGGTGGGTGGNGGQAGSNLEGGGGGFLTNGGGSGGGGLGFNGTGGTTSNTNSGGGGVGGGGTSGTNSYQSGGGGGGVCSGGGAASNGGGGGGGSINNGSSQVNTAGTNAGGGYVTIQCLGVPSIGFYGGNSQSTAISTAFATNLSVKVLDASSNPLSGISVTFTAPASGASGTFSNSRIADTVTTNASGVADAGTFTANNTAGANYTVTASVTGTSLSANFSLTNIDPCAEFTNGIAYVNINATGSNDGATWANAFTSLQSALSVARTCTGITQIWIAKGTYKPGTNRTDSFSMVNGVKIYGGFSGTETLLPQRNWTTNPTILSGDLNGDDVITGSGATLSITNNSDNSYHVINNYNNRVTSTAVLDGFTISGGNASGTNGGGMLNISSSPTLANLTFSGNNASSDGGGIYNSGGSSPTLTNLTFSVNNASVGGGIYKDRKSTRLTSVTFSGNNALNGGGMDIDLSSSPTLTNVTFSGNASHQGGGIFIGPNSSVSLTNVTMSGNSASILGGAIGNSGLTVNCKNTIIAQNSSPQYPDGFGPVTSQGNNLIGNGTGTTGFTNGTNNDQVGTAASPINPLLAPLGNYGGTTQTMALLPGSPAINAGTSTGAPTTDQRGDSRVGAVDIGAFESQGFTLTKVPAGENQSATVSTNFTNPLSVTVTPIHPTEPVNGGQVIFAPPAQTGASCTIDSKTGNDTITIASGMATTGTVTANANAGNYPVSAGAAGVSSPVSFSLTNVLVTVTNVSSTTANGTYNVGQVIAITVTFSTPVTVTGTPQLALNSGGTASYSSGTGTPTLTFSYTVGGGQSSAHLDYTSTTALNLNGGTIGGGSPASLTLPAPGTIGSLSANTNIVIVNTTTINSINLQSATPNNATSISYQVVFGASVTGLTFNNFSLTTDGSISGAQVTGVSGSGTTWSVTVSTGSGDGHITLNLINDNGLTPGISTTLPFAGQTCTIAKTATAYAGPNQSLLAGTISANLSGSGTGSGTLTYLWTQTGGAAASITNNSLASTAVTGLTTGTYTFRLTVTDQLNNTAIGSVTITINTSLTNGLISYWPLNESSGMAIDVADGDNGTPSGVMQGVPGKLSTAYSFNGTSSKVDMGNPASGNLNLSGAGTISAWVNMPSLSMGHDGLVVGKGNWSADRNGYLIVYLNSTHSFAAELANATTHQTFDFSGVTIAPNTWYHLVVTWNGANVVTYINGANASTRAETVIPVSNVSNFGVGQSLINSGHDFLGTIDEVGMWNRALTSIEVAGLYNSGTGLAYPFITGTSIPTANAGSNQSLPAGTTTANLSGSGSDVGGTITGYAWMQTTAFAGVTITPSTSPATPGSAQVTGLTNGHTYTFQLTVTDNNNNTAVSSVNITIANPPTSNSSLLTGIISYWPLNETGPLATGSAIDVAGGGNNGTPSAVIDGATGILNTAYLFNGTTSKGIWVIPPVET